MFTFGHNNQHERGMKGFKAYDIRGVYIRDFSARDVFRLGYFLPRLLSTGKILVGRDHRLSSDEIHDNLVRGITTSGAGVWDMGLATTPMLYYAAGRHGFDGAVQITASHNPAEYNGFKVSGREVMPVGYADGLNQLEKWVLEGTAKPVSTPGKVHELEVRDDYLRFLRSYRDKAVDGLKLAVDCSNGMAGYVVRDILGDGVHYLFEQPDGRFPNHDPNPLKAENHEPLRKTLLEEGCDAGILFDGDADRVIFLDEQGCFIPPDLIIALMGHYFLDQSGGRVLQDIRSSRSVKAYLAPLGAEVHTWKVGRAFACPRMKELNALYGGEFAGHYYFRDFFYSDSAMLAMIVVLNVLARFKKEGLTLSGLVDRISRYYSSGELNYCVHRKGEAIEAVVNSFLDRERPEEQFDFDGVRLDYADWWFNIRPSNTEPYLRVIVEAVNRPLLEEKVKKIQQILHPYRAYGVDGGL